MHVDPGDVVAAAFDSLIVERCDGRRETISRYFRAGHANSITASNLGDFHFKCPAGSYRIWCAHRPLEGISQLTKNQDAIRFEETAAKQ